MITLTHTDLTTMRTAEFSTCMKYRFSLSIIWNPGIKPQMFIGLNGSVATHLKDDPTVRRCIDFSQSFGAGGLVMCNAFAFMATDPKVMLRHYEPIGKENTLEFLSSVAMRCLNRPIAAWGCNANKNPSVRRGDYLKRFMGKLDCLRITKEGNPEHPLYLPATLKPIPFNYTEEPGNA